MAARTRNAGDASTIGRAGSYALRVSAADRGAIACVNAQAQALPQQPAPPGRSFDGSGDAACPTQCASTDAATIAFPPCGIGAGAACRPPSTSAKASSSAHGQVATLRRRANTVDLAKGCVTTRHDTLAGPCAEPGGTATERRPATASSPRGAMNYRHGFHAGNFADVFKHTVLIELLEALKAKPAPFCYVDTHAGSGLYDLRGEQARQTREHVDGVQRLAAARDLPAALQRYLDLVRGFADEPGPIATYPGSPLVAARVMREDDRAILCELQPSEAEALRAALHRDRRFAIHERDGYEALGALLPPAQKRGLVLVDPPFEAQAGEYRLIEDAFDVSLARWPNAVHAVWYPIKLRETILPFHRWLRERGGADGALVAELLLHPDNSMLRLNGCGMAILNPPWQFDQALAAWLPTLEGLLAQGRYGSSRIERLKPA